MVPRKRGTSSVKQRMARSLASSWNSRTVDSGGSPPSPNSTLWSHALARDSVPRGHCKEIAMIKKTVFLAIVFIASQVPLQGADERMVTVVMLGDSTTLCQGSPKGKKVTDQVEEGLRARLKDTKVTVINSGQGSD